MQKNRLSLLLAAGAIAGIFTTAQTPEAQACASFENRLQNNYSATSQYNSYCVALDNDLEIRRVGMALRNQGIVKSTLTTKDEAGTCTLYLVTRQGEFHRRFNIGDYTTETTFARANTYFGFRLGC